MKKFANLFSIAFLLVFLSACSNSKLNSNSTKIWVSGYKVVASAGAGKSMVYLVNKNLDYKEGNWEYFYAPIDGFSFEEGVLKQIEITEEKLDTSTVPADASSIQYTFVKDVQALPDPRLKLKGKWAISKINGETFDEKIEMPTMEIDFNQLLVSGSDGCNQYSGKVLELTASEIQIGELASTKRACLKADISHLFYPAMKGKLTYEEKNGSLILKNASGELNFILSSK